MGDAPQKAHAFAHRGLLEAIVDIVRVSWLGYSAI